MIDNYLSTIVLPLWCGVPIFSGLGVGLAFALWTFVRPRQHLGHGFGPFPATRFFRYSNGKAYGVDGGMFGVSTIFDPDLQGDCEPVTESNQAKVDEQLRKVNEYNQIMGYE